MKKKSNLYRILMAGGLLLVLLLFNYWRSTISTQSSAPSSNTTTQVSQASSTSKVSTDKKESSSQKSIASSSLDRDGQYTSKEEVAAYLHQYGKLPSNYISKEEAEKLGWEASKGNLQEVAPGKSIGGSRFGNYEGVLPEGSYKECDIDYAGGRRNAKRIVWSKEGIYYTEDHYKSFEKLY